MFAKVFLIFLMGLFLFETIKSVLALWDWHEQLYKKGKKSDLVLHLLTSLFMLLASFYAVYSLNKDVIVWR
jgi:hypothetical protein